MWVYTVLAWASLLATGQPATPPPVPPPYPDLSDPKAAAFSLAAALANGDVKVAREIYVGKEKPFLEYLDALAKMKAKFDRLQRAIITRFGESGWKAYGGRPFGADLEMRVGEKGDTKASMGVVIAVAEVKQQGNEATLKLSQDLAIRLQKTDAGWKVTNWPGISPLGSLNLELTERFLDELTGEIEKGKYQKVYEVAAAAQRIREKQTAELFKELDKGKKDDKKSPNE